MLNRRRGLSVAAFLFVISGVTGVGALAQDTNTLGPAQLKDFRLPGQRTTPPITTAPPPTQVQPARTQTVPPPAQPRAEASPSVIAGPARRTIPASVRREAPPPAAIPAQPAPVPAPSATQPAPIELPAAAPPVAAPGPETDAAPPTGGYSSPYWIWGGIAALAGLAIFGALRFRRRQPRSRSQESLGAALAPLPAPDRAAPPAGRPAEPPAEPVVEPLAAAPEETPRAWVELDFIPEKAAATPTEAVVHFELVLRNKGDGPARNIRIDARMFNAGAQAEIGLFLSGPIHEKSGSPHVQLEAGGELRIASRVAMPNEEVREIQVQGRNIFVPIVAANVAYDWGEGGGGRTSKSWLVGREAESPTARMGAFRLDQGPRIYRSVDRREAQTAQMV